MITYTDDFIEPMCKLNTLFDNLSTMYSLIEFYDHADHTPPLTSPTNVYNNITSSNKINTLITNIDMDHGGDIPEAVADAFHEVNKLILKTHINVIIYISDAYPHGYHTVNDTYPQGCPCNLNYKKQINKLNQKNIKFILYDINFDNFINDTYYLKYILRFRKKLLKLTSGILTADYKNIKNYILRNI